MKKSISIIVPLIIGGLLLLSFKQDTLLNKVSGVEVYLTAFNTTDRLSKKAPLTFEPLNQLDENEATIFIDGNKTFQTIEGFGGALTDAAAETFYKLPAAKQKEIMIAYFDQEKGIGYSLCRTHIHSCDFSSDMYVYANAGDTALAKFSIEHDLKYRVPFIKEALKTAQTPFKLFASPWSPPAWMKTNNNMLQGGKLKPEYAGVWAKYYTRFIREYEKQGIPIWGLTVQNEPMAVQTWESCIYTAEEEKDFVKNYLGPELHKAGLSGIKLMIWDHNRGFMYQRAKVAYEDKEAMKYIWGMGYHWYAGDHFDNVKAVHDAFPDKNLLFTEGCHYPYDTKGLSNWKYGELYAKSIIEDLNNWTQGWVDWNVLLDETGGPNHVANFCYAPIIGNTKTGEVTYMNSYYYLGHFSKFIRPGAKRISASSTDDRFMTTAFVNKDGRKVVVVMNNSDDAIKFQLWQDGKVAKTASPAHSIMTYIL
jgi:glucosylceramidase